MQALEGGQPGTGPRDVTGSIVSRVVKWSGRAIKEANKTQSSIEAGGLFAGFIICFPFSKGVAFVLLVVNVGTYAANIAANAVERSLSPATCEVFQKLRGKIKEIKDKVPIVLMAAVAAGIGLISWPMGMIVAGIVVVIRGFAAVSANGSQENPDSEEFGNVTLEQADSSV